LRAVVASEVGVVYVQGDQDGHSQGS